MSRAVVFHEFGSPEVLRIKEVETEQPGPGEVRLRIRAIELNRTGLTLRSGRTPIKPQLPSRIGFEAAGEIEALGPGVAGHRLGKCVALVPISQTPAWSKGLPGMSLSLKSIGILSTPRDRVAIPITQPANKTHQGADYAKDNTGA